MWEVKLRWEILNIACSADFVCYYIYGMESNIIPIKGDRIAYCAMFFSEFIILKAGIAKSG